MEQVLFIAPTETIADGARQVASKMKINLPIVIGKLEEIENIVRRHADIHIYQPGWLG